MPTEDSIRAAQRSAWARLAPGWDRWADTIGRQLAPVSAAMVEQLAVADGQLHLDVASGTGEPGLTIAESAPRGRVVLTDLSPEMLTVARRQAAARGVVNTEAWVCSADALPVVDAAFDTATVRFGLMFVPDPARAVRELARVLRANGRVSASVWVRPEANPWTAVVLDAIATEVALPRPDPDSPHMFRCAEPGQVAALYTAVGLVDVEERDVAVELVTPSPEEYWAVMSEHVSLAVHALASVDPAARARIREAAIDGVAPYERDGVVRVPGVARCVVGRKPPDR